MLGLQESVWWAVGEARGLVHARGLMFTWNLLLAFIPLCLALVLFQPSSRRTPAWWFGLGAFVVFLPNAAYVITDVVHLFTDVRRGESDLSLITVHGPVYGVFFALGFTAYVLSLLRMQEYLAVVAPRMRWWPVELGLHLAVAVAIFFGRVLRFNSWDVMRAPSDLTDALPVLTTRFPLLFIGFTFVVLVVLAAVVKPTVRAALGWTHRMARRLEQDSAGGSPVE